MLRRNSEVFIHKNLDSTKKRFGLDPEMVRMSGSKHIVDHVGSDGVEIRGYTFSLMDITPVNLLDKKIEVTEKIFHFDVNTLDIKE